VVFAGTVEVGAALAFLVISPIFYAVEGCDPRSAATRAAILSAERHGPRTGFKESPMPEPKQPPATPPSDVAARLREVARLVREADHLDPEAQQTLADLAEQMADNLSQPHVPTAEEVELGKLAGELIEVLHREEKPPAAGRHRLQKAIVAAEARAPLAAETARELLDALANLGI
jgi:hypothetical protein